jgi:glycosyltransferase involved in cell wall biosynthesis
MAIRTILVCEAQVPLVSGGAESHVRQLVAQLEAHGYQVGLVSLPFKWYPKEEILAHAAAWRLIDLSESNGVPIDLVVATKFPSYFVRHPNKTAWLIHQYRAAYELCGTQYSDFAHVDLDVGLRQKLIGLDTEMLGECRRLYTNARNTAARVAKYNGLHAEPLYHPPRLADRLESGPFGEYILSVGRLETVKRVDLGIRALAASRATMRLIVAGTGTQDEALRRLAVDLGVAHRVEFAGAVDDDRLIRLYAGALGVLYAPFDEDFGYVTLESFLAHKPVITARDSGGTLEFVEDGVNGYVCEPEPDAITEAFSRLADDVRRAKSMGDAGYDRARLVTWAGVVEKLVGE